LCSLLFFFFSLLSLFSNFSFSLHSLIFEIQWLKNERYKKLVEKKLKESKNPQGTEFLGLADAAQYNDFIRTGM
jgi:hypothetical protein